MATTQLSPAGLPGRRYSFSVGAGPHTGEFTELSVLGVPGKRHAFVGKQPTGGKGRGPFTYISVTATPGQTYTFVAKTAAIGEEVEQGGGSSKRKWIYRRPNGKPINKWEEIMKDDQEVMEFVQFLMSSGVLDEL